jgi:hypothetical protein
VAKQKQRCAKENIMAELKIGGMTLDEIREAMKGDGKTRFFGKTKEEIQANRRAINESFLPKTKTTPGNIASRTDFSDEKMGPKFKADTKPIKKITKEKVSVETPSGNIGSVDRTADVIGPDMSKVIKDVVATKPAREFTATEMAQNLMSPGYNKMKKGGAVKKMSSGGKVSSASKRADGIATKGKTRGKMC